MIDAEGTITGLEDGFAVVRMDEAGCGRCEEEGGCGGHNMGRMFCHAPRTFRVLNPANALIGQRVRIVVPDGAVRRSAIYAYGLPLLALFAGAIFGSMLAGEMGAIFGASLCLLFSWVVLWRSKSSPSQDKRLQPTIRA